MAKSGIVTKLEVDNADPKGWAISNKRISHSAFDIDTCKAKLCTHYNKHLLFPFPLHGDRVEEWRPPSGRHLWEMLLSVELCTPFIVTLKQKQDLHRLKGVYCVWNLSKYQFIRVITNPSLEMLLSVEISSSFILTI